MSAAPGSEGGRAAGVHLEVEGDDRLLEAPCAVHMCHFKDYARFGALHITAPSTRLNLLRAAPCFQVRGRRFRARFPAQSRCERPFCPP
jgi:hypothetical protein